MNTALVNEVAQLEIGVTRSQVLDESFVAVAHHVMQSDQSLEDHDPVLILRPLDQQISQGRDRNVGLLRAVKKILKHKGNKS